MVHVMVSTCLLGQPVRYNAADAPSDKEILSRIFLACATRFFARKLPQVFRYLDHRLKR